MRLTRRAFIQASAATAACWLRLRDATPVSAAMAPRKMRAAARQGRVGRQHLPGLHAVVRDPDLRAGRARRSSARQPAIQDQPRLTSVRAATSSRSRSTT